MPRTVKEWIGKTDDTPVPPRVKIRVFEAHKGICHISGRKIRPGDAWQCDHVKPIIADGENRESNLAPALTEPHKEKTAQEVADKSKIARIRKKHLGIDDKSSSFRKPTRTNADGDVEYFTGFTWKLKREK